MTIFAFMKKMNIKNKYVFSLVIIDHGGLLDPFPGIGVVV